MAKLKFLGKYKDSGLMLMRAGLGVMMVLHGWPKITGGPGTWEKIGGAMAQVNIHFAPVFWGFMAAASEAVGGLCLVLGLFFRPASFLLLFTMIIATLLHLGKGEGIMGASHAIELAFVFAGFLFVGPGKYSVDKS